MKSVLYCGCTVNAYMPCSPARVRLSLACHESSCFPRISLFLSLPAVCSWPVVSSSLFARYLARWAPAQPMKARGGELLRRSYGMAGIAEGGWKEVVAGGGGGDRCLRNVLIVSATPCHPPSFLPPSLFSRVSTRQPRQPPCRVPLHHQVYSLFSARRGTVLRILMDRLRNCWRN